MAWREALADATATGLSWVLRGIGRNFSRHVAFRLYHVLFRPDEGLDVRLHAPPITRPDDDDGALVRRILSAFRLAKRDQERADPRFLPASLWRHQLDRAYRSLEGSEDEAGFFLRHFGAWPEYTGIEHADLIRSCQRSRRVRRFFEKYAFPAFIREWGEYESNGRGIDVLARPMVGNLYGVCVDGVCFPLTAIPDDVHSREILRLVSADRPVIAELGQGYGGLAWTLFQKRQAMTYVGFDLPETLCCSAYYLMSAFPEKRFLLYGEGELDLASHDVSLLPSFAIDRLAPRCVDVFVNRSSLGEMRPETATMFIERITSAARSFWHSNHETLRNTFEDGTRSLVNREYPIPGTWSLITRGRDRYAIPNFIEPHTWDRWTYSYVAGANGPGSALQSSALPVRQDWILGT